MPGSLLPLSCSLTQGARSSQEIQRRLILTHETGGHEEEKQWCAQLVRRIVLVPRCLHLRRAGSRAHRDRHFAFLVIEAADTARQRDASAARLSSP